MEPVVQNASNKKQVKAATQKEKRVRDRELEDLRAVLLSREGRRFVWRLLSFCKVFGTVFHSSGSQVYYNAGQQDVGHFVLSEVTAVDENKLIEMMREEKEENDG